MNDPEIFRAQLETGFQTDTTAGPIALRLVEVSDRGPENGMRQFSLLFHGPPDPVLPQNTYVFRHEALGPLAIFIVPIVGSNQERILYQACFSVAAT